MSLSPSTPEVLVREPDGGLGKHITSVMFGAPLGIAILAVGTRSVWVIVVGAVFSALLAVIAQDTLRAALGWNQPVIEISRFGYALGSTPTITYRRRPKRVLDISSCRVDCRLVCQERATYTHGSDTSTETRDVYESRSSGSGEGSATGLIATVDLDISAHRGVASFKLPNNEVRWFAEITISGPRLPKDSHTFVIDVAPRLDPRYRAPVQDT